MRPAAPLLPLLLAWPALAWPAAPGPEALEPLVDNSFLVEEAFNQEPGVVQNILTFARDRASGAWVSTFTQEWPAPDQDHQLSYTLSFGRNAEPGRGLGLGDLLLNWRYRAASDGNRMGFTPRLSVVVPAGRAAAEIGYGGWGAQANLPISTGLGRALIAHSNLGATWVPEGRSGGERTRWISYSLAQSLVWLVHPRLNLLAEVVWVGNERTAGGVTARDQTLTVSPGVRAGFDLPGDTQVVIGAAIPLGLGPSAGDVAVFGYLSVELPFRRAAQQAPEGPPGVPPR